MMKAIQHTFILLLTLVFHFAMAQQQDDNTLIAQFDTLLSSKFKPNEPGATVLVSRRGQVIYQKAFGMANLELRSPMQMDNVFWIASIGKEFTAVAILQLMEQGKLNLHDDIKKYIPDYPTHGNTITIEHLLTHTSGIHNYSGMPDPEKRLAYDCTPTEVIDFFKNLPMRFTPGTKYEYSNSGYFLLGYIIEIISGQTYQEYLEENILKPAGMTNSLFASNKSIVANRVDGYSYGETGYENARSLNMTHIFSAGAIQSTVPDFYKWHQAIQSCSLIKKETRDKAFSRYRLTDGTAVEYGYGRKLGFVYGSPSVWHGGSIEGFGNMEIYLPDEDVLVVIFTNCDCHYPKEIASRIAALATGRPHAYKEIPVSEQVLAEYAGVYEHSENNQSQLRVITVGKDGLVSQLGRGPKLALKACQKDKFFFVDDAMQTITFSKNGTHDGLKMTTEKLTGVEVWIKSKKPIPDSNGIDVKPQILDTYAGEYEIPSMFTFSIAKVQDQLYLIQPDQEKIEMFADSETLFFLKVNDARFEFVSDDSGKVSKVILHQGGRTTEANKIK